MNLVPVAGGRGLSRTTNGVVNLAVDIRGSGPAVVLLHGTSANHAVWTPVAEVLANQARVISVDQRGHGRSDKPMTGYGGEDFASDLITVLDALDEPTAVVVGHSMGARNAWVAASMFPTRVAGVISLDYTPFVEDSVLDDLAVRVAGGDRLFAALAEIEDYIAARYPRLPTDAVERRARWGYGQVDGGWRPLADPGAMQQLVAGLRRPHEREFRDVSVPMTHVRGIDSRILSESAWDAARALRPDDRWVVDPDADHYVAEESVHLVSAEIQRIVTLTTTHAVPNHH